MARCLPPGENHQAAEIRPARPASRLLLTRRRRGQIYSGPVKAGGFGTKDYLQVPSAVLPSPFALRRHLLQAIIALSPSPLSFLTALPATMQVQDLTTGETQYFRFAFL